MSAIKTPLINAKQQEQDFEMAELVARWNDATDTVEFITHAWNRYYGVPLRRLFRIEHFERTPGCIPEDPRYTTYHDDGHPDNTDLPSFAYLVAEREFKAKNWKRPGA
jgi:hypothetical protein